MRALAPLLVLLCLAPAAVAAPDDDAVLAKALDFVVAKQSSNGGFGQIPGEGEGEVGITSMVLRALATAPEPHRAKVRPAAEKAAAYVLGCQQADGSFTQGRSGLTTYRTAMAITALGAFDRARYAEQIAKAAAFLQTDQLDDGEQVDPTKAQHGGFGYGKAGRGGGGADLSNTHIALGALRDAGVPATDPVFQRALVFLRRCQNDSEVNDGAGIKPTGDGGFAYEPGGRGGETNPDGTKSLPSYASMTYAGLLSLAFAGQGDETPAVRAALAWIRDNYTLEENRGLGTRGDPKAGQQGLYYYYYTFAKCLAARGKETVATAKGERPWARDLWDALAARQRPDGSFVNQQDGRHWEQDPVLCTAYALNALADARPFLTASTGPR